MKLAGFLILIATTVAVFASTKPTCKHQPKIKNNNLKTQGFWNCPNSTDHYKTGDVCKFSSNENNKDNCVGKVTCKKGKWKGKSIKCSKNCNGPPKNPKYGGFWSCDNEQFSSCNLNIESGFKCWNSVNCNQKTGKWRGKVECRFHKKRPLPPGNRPGGSYKCNNNK